MGSGFGGGSSGTVFGSGGAGNFLTKATTYIAVAFFLTSFALAYFAKQKSVAARELGIPAVVEQVPVEAGIELPALDGAKGEDDSELPNVDEADSEIPEA
jgi:preprotein translocase subunit SecG